MSPYDQKIKQLIEATPFWEKDGGGIRGRTIAPLLGGSMGLNAMEESLPQLFNQQTNRSFAQQEESLPDLILPATSGGGGSVPHPWQIKLRAAPNTSPTQYEFKVDLNSMLYSLLGTWDNNIEVDGLDDWKTAGVGYIILSGTVENGFCTEASIEGPEATLPERVKFSGVNQDNFTVKLGYLYEEDESLLILQNAFQDLTIIDTCLSGKPAIYPIPT